MSYFEYRTVPAPSSVPKVKGVKAPEARFGHALAEILNREGEAGWEFQSAETMTTTIKRGMFSKRETETLTVLVFRRWVETEPQTDWRETASTPEHLAAEIGSGSAATDAADAREPGFSARRDTAGAAEMRRIEGATRR